MGKITGFLEYERKNNDCFAPKERIKNFNEFHEILSESERKIQAARCMDCGVPFCQSTIRLSGMVTGCPLHNLIPEWNDQIYNGNYSHGLSRLLKTSPFPEFTGRVCPALCEKACLCGMNDEAVSIHDNELFLIENGFAQGLMTPRPPEVRSGKKVAVIGSGPSGLATAQILNRRGHAVTIYEKADRPGGLLMYGIPNMKLEKQVIERRIKLMEAEGINFVMNADFGNTLNPAVVMKEFDAVVLCCGAEKARDIGGVGRNVEGVHFAVDFLKSTTKSLLDDNLADGTYISAKDKHVIIVGGGDTGNDCVGTSIRHGCKSVTQLEINPQPPVERAASNPWPEWPKVLNTDYGQEEAIAVFGKDPRIFETTIKEFIAEDGKLSAVKTVKMQFVDGNMCEVEGSEKTLPADMVLIAAGFVGCKEYTVADLGVELTARNNVATDAESYKTNVDKVFTAGDMHRGQSLVVWAISEGIACAKEVDKFLMGYSNI